MVRKGTKVGPIPVLVGVPETGASKDAGPKARLVKKEDGTMQIEVRCACGKKIIMECDFE